MYQPVNFFWYGPRIGKLEIACLTSFHRHGHPVVLHAYDPPENLPGFARWQDAAEIMPEAEHLRLRQSGWITMSSNRYRYKLIEAGCGLYSDCDMYCIAPIKDRPYIYGWEYLGSINCAFLKYPPGSDLSRMMLSLTEDVHFVPPWLRRRERAWLHLRKALGRGLHVGLMPWGTWGPVALTHAIRTLGLTDHAQPIDAFYPLPGNHFELLFDPEMSFDDFTTARTQAVHLWNNMFGIAGMDRAAAPPRGSPMDEVLRSADA